MLNKPIGILDLSLGGEAFIKRLRQAYPQQDIIYASCAANWPAGSAIDGFPSSHLDDTALLLAGHRCCVIFLLWVDIDASILQRLRQHLPVPVVATYLPIQDATLHSQSGRVALLLDSPPMSLGKIDSCLRELCPQEASISLIDASPLAHLIEPRAKTPPSETTMRSIQRFVAALARVEPDIDVLILPPTSLALLSPTIRLVAPELIVMDTFDALVRVAGTFVSPGVGSLSRLAPPRPEKLRNRPAYRAPVVSHSR